MHAGVKAVIRTTHNFLRYWLSMTDEKVLHDELERIYAQLEATATRGTAEVLLCAPLVPRCTTPPRFASPPIRLALLPAPRRHLCRHRRLALAAGPGEIGVRKKNSTAYTDSPYIMARL